MFGGYGWLSVLSIFIVCLVSVWLYGMFVSCVFFGWIGCLID